jgi:hypothetical protein
MERIDRVSLVLVFIGILLASMGIVLLACEDNHPPVVATPSKRFDARDSEGKGTLTVSFDPRGVGTVVPEGDELNRWIDTHAPTGAWHYREWQWWKGHPWGDSCRPRYYSEVAFRPLEQMPSGAVINYRIDGFDCRQTFLVPEIVDSDAPHWDLVTTVRNATGQDVDEYGQFFACYTPLNRGQSFWYWDESGDLVRFSDRGVSHLDGYIVHPQAYFLEQGAIPHCPRGGGKIVGRWRRPVMVSHASPAGWRSVILLETAHVASLAQGIEGGAMDYILFPGPGQCRFGDGAEFSAHVRHVMLKSPKLPTIDQLEGLWKRFEQDHSRVREHTARL